MSNNENEIQPASPKDDPQNENLMGMLEELFQGVDVTRPFERAAVSALLCAGAANTLAKTWNGDPYGPALGIATLTSAYIHEKNRPIMGPMARNAWRMLREGRSKLGTDDASTAVHAATESASVDSRLDDDQVGKNGEMGGHGSDDESYSAASDKDDQDAFFQNKASTSNTGSTGGTV